MNIFKNLFRRILIGLIFMPFGQELSGQIEMIQQAQHAESSPRENLNIKRHNLQWQITDFFNSENTFSYEYNFLKLGMSLGYAYGFENNKNKSLLKSRSHEFQVRVYPGLHFLTKRSDQKNQGAYFGAYYKKRKTKAEKEYISGDGHQSSWPFKRNGDGYLEYQSLHKPGVMAGYKILIAETLTVDAFLGIESTFMVSSFSDNFDTDLSLVANPRFALSLGWAF